MTFFSRGSSWSFALGVTLAIPSRVAAGMPNVTLTDAASMRLQSISFFLMVFLVVALVVRLVWNSLRTDFTRLPRLSFPKAVGVVALWGLLFMLVLVMISGARELMTPGAWKKDGVTYTLDEGKSPVPVPKAGPDEEERRARLRQLFSSLVAYASRHDGRFPLDPDDKEIPGERWKTSHPSAMRYLYLPGRTIRDPAVWMACEPELFGEGRLVLYTDGTITRMSSVELQILFKPVGK
jgi:hypothetical protein